MAGSMGAPKADRHCVVQWPMQNSGDRRLGAVGGLACVQGGKGALPACQVGEGLGLRVRWVRGFACVSGGKGAWPA